MTTIAPTTSTATAAATQDVATQQLAGNFNTFLTLLTTQLQNQDPLNPMDSNEFTQQLVEYSQVEQQINTNDNLKSLISLTQGRSASDAMNYLGKAVTITNGMGALANGSASWNYSLATAASSATLSVTDATGRVVYSGAADPTAGTHSFSWDGKDSSGNQLPDGTYKFTVSANAADGSAVQTNVATAGVVSEIDLSGTTPQLVIGPMEVPISAVSAISSL